MGQDSGGPPPATAPAKRSALSADEVRAFTDRAPRCRVALQVLCSVPNDKEGSDFLETERTVADPPRMGVRFVALEGDARTFVERLIEAVDAAPEIPTEPGFASPIVEFSHGTVRVRLTPATSKFFTFNPLLHIGVGGCFLPAQTDVPLGTGYQMDVVDQTERLIMRCKAKVAAKQERWIGLRFLDVERSALQALRAEIAKLAGPRTG